MIHLALQTEYSFKRSLLHMKDISKYVEDGMVGIADCHNTFGHIPLMMEAKKHDFKPIYGVRLHVLPNDSVQRVCNVLWVFIARNDAGLKEVNELVKKAYDNFYYIPKLNLSDIFKISENVEILTPDDMAGQGMGEGRIAIDLNNFPRPDDRKVYELLAGARKNGEGYSHFYLDQTYPQHIMTEAEWMAEYDNYGAIHEAHKLGRECNATIPQAEMVEWNGSKDILRACLNGKGKIKDWGQVHDDRLKYEIDLIKKKGYVDYFMIVADLIRHCKDKMLVGPARGSSAGSLVCYLLGITEVDPIEHKLIFERFIDINRFDLPDIDIDFPDVKRDIAIKYLKHKYGRDKVMCLANINKLKAKSAIGEFAKGLGIPSYEVASVKDAIIERTSADARAAMCIKDTLETTEPGREFIERYPAMGLVERIEGHASHAGKHAAGIIVSTLPLSTYGAINSRDEIVMIDRWGAEVIDLLKIDCLGLRTLSVLEHVARQIGMDHNEYNNLPLDDPKTYEVFNSMRLNGVFQFEGQALQLIVKQMGVRNFNDVAAITALARPGALNSGGTARYIKYVTGKDVPIYHSDIHKRITGDTFGIVVYQEQMMEIAREIGGLSWEDVSSLRKASSKTLGDEFFAKYRDGFMKGALENGYTEEVAFELWNDISSSGSWSFNKSHAVSYGLVSYWTAWAKANYPMEFAVATLDNASSNDNAIKLLRDLIKHEGVDYVPVDPDLSGIGWSFTGRTLIGGLTNIKGIANAKAKAIIASRNGSKALTPSLFKLLSNPITDFDIIFPADHYWGHLYRDPISYQLDGKPMFIKDIDGRGEYLFIGCLVDRNLRSLNEYVFTSQRNGELIEDHTEYLNLKVEDDTDMISCKIDRYKYEAIGKEIAETGRVGKDWYLIRGKIKSDWRKIDVMEIVNINKYFGVTI